MKTTRLLDRLGNGQINDDDFNYISTRFDSNVPPDECQQFKESLRLFATKDEVKEYNLKKLSTLRDRDSGHISPVAKIVARHNCKEAKNGTADNYDGLEPVIYISKECKVMLKSNLWVEKGLVNGSIGKVIDIIYDAEKDASLEFPSVILCHFRQYTGPSIIPGDENIIPIRPMLKSNADNGSYTRCQFPLTLCFASTIHKAQGMTLDKAVLNIGPREFSFGLSYVAFSRVRSISDLLISPFLKRRLMEGLQQTPKMKKIYDFVRKFCINIKDEQR